MKKIMLTLLFFLSLSLGAIQWPVEDLKPQNYFFQNGLPMQWRFSVPEKVEVKPIDDGEIIFLYNPEQRGLTLSDNSFLVLEHENQYRSLYETDQLSSTLSQREFLSQKDTLGNPSGEMLSLSIRDIKASSWVNPLMLLPGLSDRQPVTVQGVFLQDAQGKFYTLQKNNILPQGIYNVLIQSFDTIDGYPDLHYFPYFIESRYLGNLLRSIEFNGSRYEEGSLKLMEGDSSYGEILNSPEGYINLGSLIVGSGKAGLELQISDFQGNETLLSFSIQG